MRILAVALTLAVASLSSAAYADPPPPSAAAPCLAPGPLGCVSYDRYENKKFGFVVDIPTVFVRRPADADGRGQPFELGKQVRVRAWGMYDNPPMTAQQLYGDWSRREGITFKTLVTNTWIVRGKEGGRFYYSRSILAAGVIATIEVSFVPEVADAMESVLARMGPSLSVKSESTAH